MGNGAWSVPTFFLACEGVAQAIQQVATLPFPPSVLWVSDHRRESVFGSIDWWAMGIALPFTVAFD